MTLLFTLVHIHSCIHMGCDTIVICSVQLEMSSVCTKYCTTEHRCVGQYSVLQNLLVVTPLCECCVIEHSIVG